MWTIVSFKRHQTLICFSNCFISSANSEITKSKTETIETVIEKEFYCFSQKSYCLQLWLISGFDLIRFCRYSEDQSREPDCDSLKMFVGQIPRDWKEADCRTLLEQFGDIYAINLLRDKKTSKSKGIYSLVLFYSLLNLNQVLS
jgi:hypothetical protein